VTRSPALHGLWLSVFVFEAVFKSQQVSHLVGALALGLLFAVLVVTEHRATS
jgi:low temperature requirement protein LtrA